MDRGVCLVCWAVVLGNADGNRRVRIALLQVYNNQGFYQSCGRKIDKIPDYYTLEEAQSLLSDFRQRFQAQLPNTRGKHPDPQAPIDPKTGEGKRYTQLPNFIRAIIYHTLKSQSQQTLITY